MNKEILVNKEINPRYYTGRRQKYKFLLYDLLYKVKNKTKIWILVGWFVVKYNHMKIYKNDYLLGMRKYIDDLGIFNHYNIHNIHTFRLSIACSGNMTIHSTLSENQ